MDPLLEPAAPIDVLFADGTRFLVRYGGEPEERSEVEELIVDVLLAVSDEGELRAALTAMVKMRGLSVLRSRDREPAEFVIR